MSSDTSPVIYAIHIMRGQTAEVETRLHGPGDAVDVTRETLMDDDRSKICRAPASVSNC